MAVKNLLGPVFENYIDLSDQELDAICESIEVHNYDRGVRITDIGDTENHVYFVVKGLVRRYFYRQKDEIIIQFAKEGKLICSFISFFGNKPSGEIVETIAASVLYAIDRNCIEQLCQKFPRIQSLYTAIMKQAFLNAEAKANEKLNLNAKERFLKFMEENRDLFQRVPQKHIASYLNIKPETFSRLKHLMQKKAEVFVEVS